MRRAESGVPFSMKIQKELDQKASVSTSGKKQSTSMPAIRQA
jgi:hypothetical protein